MADPDTARAQAAARSRRYRQRGRGGPARQPKPHGTVAAYRRHQRDETTPCGPLQVDVMWTGSSVVAAVCSIDGEVEIEAVELVELDGGAVELRGRLAGEDVAEQVEGRAAAEARAAELIEARAAEKRGGCRAVWNAYRRQFRRRK